jgi:hypothetical protein
LEIINKYYNKIDEFLSKPINYNNGDIKKIAYFFITVVILSMLSLFLINCKIGVIGILYFMFCMFGLVITIGWINEVFFNMLLVLSFPYIIMFITCVKILNIFLPYRGKNLNKIRYFKLRRLKRKLYYNKFKFWKR